MWWDEISGAGVSLCVTWNDAGLVRVEFDARSDTSQTRRELPSAWHDAFHRYFMGNPGSFSAVPVVLQGTPFQLSVWAALRTIPFGQVRSYGSIATQLGKPRAMRAVGAANGQNPLPVVIPCHRVVESTGALGGFSGGLANKRLLLALEGCEVRSGSVHPGQLSLVA